MRLFHFFHVVVWGMLAAVLLPGCMGNTPSRLEIFAVLPQREWADYEVDGLAQPATLHQELTWGDSEANVQSVLTVGAEQWHVDARVDATTLLIRQVNSGDTTHFPFGVEAQMPQAFGMIERSRLDPMHLVTLVGPQAALPSLGTGAGAWGEIQVVSVVEPGSWNLRAEGPCQIRCVQYTEQGTRLGHSRVQMQGDLSHMLPTFASVQIPEGDFKVDFRQIVRGSEGAHLVSFAAPLTVGPFGMALEPCLQILPCEGPDWPSHLSLTPGVEALQASPEWQSNGGASNQFPLILAVVDYSEVEGVTRSQQWVLVFGTSDGSQAYRLQRDSVAGVPLGPRMIGSGAGTPQARVPPEIPSGFIPPDVALPPALQTFGLASQDLGTLFLIYGSPLSVPDSRGAFMWAFQAPGDMIVEVSMVTGNVLAVYPSTTPFD